MKYLGTIAGLLMILGAYGHTFQGWPYFAEALESADSSLVRGVGNAWYLGSVALISFAVMVLFESMHAFRGESVSRTTVGTIALAFVLFSFLHLYRSGIITTFAFFLITGLLTSALLLSPRPKSNTEIS